MISKTIVTENKMMELLEQIPPIFPGGMMCF